MDRFDLALLRQCTTKYRLTEQGKAALAAQTEKA